jgi:predicted transcriptional regulator
VAETIRISPETHAALTRIAKAQRISLTEALSRAVELYRREQFLAGVAADYAALSSRERAAERADADAWDSTLRDGDDDA